MSAILEATELVVEGFAPALSLAIATGEIVGLLFPQNKPRIPLLRVLHGLDAATRGAVRLRCDARIVVAATGPSLADALSMNADLVLLDAGDDEADRNTWARLASERALGTSFLVATTNLDQACRADRVTMASWDMRALDRAVTALLPKMASDRQEFVALLAEGQHRRTGALAVDLRRLNIGAQALLDEMGHCAHPGEETHAWHTARWRLSGVSLSDSVLDAAVARAHALLVRQTMIVEHLPSLEALESDEQDRLAVELALASLRSRRQEIQRLAELVEHLVRAGPPDGIGEQLVEEMAWHGCHLLEGAAALCGPRPDDSAVFARAPEQGRAPRQIP